MTHEPIVVLTLIHGRQRADCFSHGCAALVAADVDRSVKSGCSVQIQCSVSRKQIFTRCVVEARLKSIYHDVLSGNCRLTDQGYLG